MCYRQHIINSSKCCPTFSDETIFSMFISFLLC